MSIWYWSLDVFSLENTASVIRPSLPTRAPIVPTGFGPLLRKPKVSLSGAESALFAVPPVFPVFPAFGGAPFGSPPPV